MRYSVNNIITWKDAVYVISRHFKFSNNINKNLKKDMRKIMEKNIINEMCRLKLLKRTNCKGIGNKTRGRGGHIKYMIINHHKSENIDKGVLANMLTIRKDI
jgi:hypothetical protein